MVYGANSETQQRKHKESSGVTWDAVTKGACRTYEIYLHVF